MSQTTNIERIIAKIDNDFNPNNSDWIPRVGAWCIDALSQLDCLKTVKKTTRATVNNGFAKIACPIDGKIKVYDANGCLVEESGNAHCGCNGNNNNPSSKGDFELTPDTINTQYNNQANRVPDATIAFTRQTKDYPSRYNVIDFYSGDGSIAHQYTKIDNCTLEINFDTPYLIIEYEGIETSHSDTFGCEFPVIPNNGRLIEAIVYYCMYKMLCRGYQHPVLNLSASQYGTNPYYIWKTTKEEARRSVINDGIDENLDDLWRSAFYIKTFNPRGK